MNIFSSKTLTNLTNNQNMRKLASQMSNHKALLPVIMLESTVISGRTYHAYKRGGMTEARERMIDETITAAVWFGIISWINSGFNKLIKQKGIFDKKGLPEITIDLGKDAIRNPIGQAIKKRPEIQNKIGGLKFTKIAVSALAGIYLSGVIVPKFYQSLTEKILHKERKTKQPNNKIDFEEFLKRTNKKSVAFGSASNIINTTAHILENNPIAKLLTVDVGLFAGRGYSARNNDERFELLFRDFSSSFFYMASTPLVYMGLSKYVDKFRGKNTELDPNTVHFLTEKIKKTIGNGMDINTFKEVMFGTGGKEVAKIIPKLNGETMSIKEFEKLLPNLTANKEQAQKVLENAAEFIKLRPEGASKELLSVSEIINSLQGGKINSAKLLTDAVNVATDGISQNPEKFISFKEIDKIKIKIRKYAESIVDYAKTQGKDKITEELLTQSRNRNFVLKVAYTVAGLFVSSVFLSTIIPKLQYKMTEWRTGRNDFPGIKDIK